MYHYGAFETEKGWLGYYQYRDYARDMWITTTANDYEVDELSALVMAFAACNRHIEIELGKLALEQSASQVREAKPISASHSR